MAAHLISESICLIILLLYPVKQGWSDIFPKDWATLEKINHSFGTGKVEDHFIPSYDLNQNTENSPFSPFIFYLTL